MKTKIYTLSRMKDGIALPARHSGQICRFKARDFALIACVRLRSSARRIFFFGLSNFQGWLIGYIENHRDFIKPLSRYNEVLSFLKRYKLNDLCISRPRARLGWGIDIPFSKEHVTYVWFDALINYISAVGFSYDEAKFKRYWPVDLHLIGKDILRQHAIYWPIILRALNL